METLPGDMWLGIKHVNVRFKVPNFHLPGHWPGCHAPFSFHYMWGVGRTHGETVEQNWEFTNGAAPSTKMMGMGTRHATLEDLFRFHNWRRLVASRCLFPSRMPENVKESQVHHEAFEAFDDALRAVAPELVAKWKTMVHEGESSEHSAGDDSPSEQKEKVMSMHDIQLKLAREETLRSGDDVEVEREDTPSTFVLMGMDIEETHCQPNADSEPGFLETAGDIDEAPWALWDTETEWEAEAARLFLPSDLSDKTKRDRACAAGLAEVEAELRVGEAREVLHALRHGLQMRTMTNRFRLHHCTGQRMLTRGQGVLRQINLKIHRAKLRYRHGPWEAELKVLEDSDVCALNERALTAEEAEERKRIHRYGDVEEEGGVAAFGVVALGETHRQLSWIWYSAGCVGEPSKLELEEALHVEWCKAYARMRRWNEDVVLVEEEMRCTLGYGHWMAAEWATRGGVRATDVNTELQEGLAAYAREQHEWEMTTCGELAAKWAGIRGKGRAFLAREAVGGADVIVSFEDDEEGVERDDEEEGPPDYKDEGDNEILE
ncbi:hypothetical protein K438DRAFT_1960011 [Mycena galopus ATCC 62051]|nr:hypothetical protein K438DRAFT_1960011 [Mycena galopus ATCC 62051]